MADDSDVKLLADLKKKPLAERVEHSNWKARSAAYEDIAAACAGIYDDEDPRLSEYGSLFVKAAADSHAAALDKALDALIIFLSKAQDQHVNRYAEKTCSNLVNKALNGRTGTVARATEALHQFVELEQSTAVVDALIEGYKNKVAKLVLASLDATIAVVSSFGTKVVLPVPILKALPTVLDSKDGKVRDKAKELTIELSRWIGVDAVRNGPLWKAMRDAIKDEVERGMQNAQAMGRPEAQRFTRKEQARRAAAAGMPADTGAPAAQDNAAPGAVVEEQPELSTEMDPYDVSDPKDILKELRKDFYSNETGTQASKWSERKAALTHLKELASYPRLASGRDVDYGDLNRELRRLIIKDSNVSVVAEAIACIGALAQGLRSAYSASARGFVEILLEKYKEKNSAVGKAISETLTIMHKHCFTLQDVAENFVGSMGSPNPKVKEETLTWLKSAVTSENKQALTKLAPVLLPPAAKCAEEAAPSLREAAMGFMVAFAIKFGNPAVLEKFTAKLDDGKKKRLEELLTEARGGSGAAGATATTANGKPPTGSTVPIVPVLPSSARQSTAAAALAASKSASVRVPSARTSAAGTASAAPAASREPAANGNNAKKAAPAKETETEDEAALASGTLSKDDAKAKLIDFVGEETVKQLSDDQWKTRLDAMEVVVGKARSLSGDSGVQGAILVQALAHVPGFSDKNFQVMSKVFEVIQVVGSSGCTFRRQDAYVAITGIVDKISDIKLKGPGGEALMSVSEAVGPAFVASMLHKKAAVHKNPKVLSESYVWLAQAIMDFGLACFNVKALLDWAKEDLQSANAGVRNSVIQMLGIMHRFLGSPLGDMIRSDVKPALMAAIDGEFAKNPKDTSIAPTRASRVDSGSKKQSDGKGGSMAGSAHGPAGGAGGGVIDTDDLLPRTDISGSISGAILNNMASSNWKERKEAMDAVDALITSSGGRIQPQLGELVPALKARLADTNKNLVAAALQLVGRLAKAMGRPADRVARPLLGPSVKNLSDIKPNVRAAACEMLSAWVGACGADSVMSELVEALSSAKATADGKAEGMNWLAGQVAESKVMEAQLGDTLRLVVQCTADKAAAVRDAANKVTTALLQVYSPAQLSQAAGQLDGTAKKAALEVISKAAGTPVAALSTAAAAPAPGPRSSIAGASRPASTGGSRPATAAAGRASMAGKPPSNPALRSSLTLNKSAGLSGKGGDLSDDVPLFLHDTKKDDRAKKGKFRPNKLEIRPDEAATLEADLSPLVSPSLKALLFAKEFKKHCEAADMIKEYLAIGYDDVMSVLDLLFRWCTLRIADANTQSLVKVLDLLKEIFSQMEQRDQKLSDYEAKLILPILVEKSGHNQEKIKADHKELLRKASTIHSPTKVAAFIKDGLESKNNKSRVVCAEELGQLIDKHGPVIYYTPGGKPAPGSAAEGLLAAIAKLVAERDNSLRTAALFSLEAAYAYEGADGLWRLLGKGVTDAARTLIEERLKYTDKELARKGLKPGYKGADVSQETVAPDQPFTGLGAMSGPPSPRRAPSPSPAALNGRPASPGHVPASPAGVTRPASAAAAGARTAGAAGGSILAGVGQTSQVARHANISPHASNGGALDSRRDAPSNAAGLGPMSQASPADLAYLRSSTANLNVNRTATTPEQVGLPIQSLSKASAAAFSRDMQECIHNLQSPDMEVCVAVMKLLCYELMELNAASPPWVLATFQEHASGIITIMAAHMEDVILAAGQGIAATGGVQNNRACKYTLNMLMNCVSNRAIAQSVEEGPLRSLLSGLLLCLLDERLGQVPEGVAMLKAMNLLMMKILENCNRTYVFCVLVGLLLSVHPKTASLGPADRVQYVWCDLVVKCLIKMTKMLQTMMQVIDVKMLLYAIHNFFETLGGEEIRKRGAQEDKPLRMVKTILHELCRLKGAAIHFEASSLPGADMHPSLKPIIFAYIDLNLQTLKAATKPTGNVESVLPAPAAVPAVEARPLPAPVAPPAATFGSAFATSQMTSSTEQADVAPPQAKAEAMAAGGGGVLSLQPSSEVYRTVITDYDKARSTLSSIFKRIADTPNERQQALVDLHFFTSANPNTDMDAMLQQASTTFRNYILKGLQKVRLQVGQQQRPELRSFAVNVQADEPAETDMSTTTMSRTANWAINIPQTLRQSAEIAGSRAAGPVAALKLTSSYNTGQASPRSPGSPSGGLKNTTRNVPVVGEDKIAELRDRMTRMQLDVSNLQIRNSNTNAVAVQAAATTNSSPTPPEAPEATSQPTNISDPGMLMPDTSISTSQQAIAPKSLGTFDEPDAGDAGGSSSLADLQERMRRLRAQEVGQ